MSYRSYSHRPPAKNSAAIVQVLPPAAILGLPHGRSLRENRAAILQLLAKEAIDASNCKVQESLEPRAFFRCPSS